MLPPLRLHVLVVDDDPAIREALAAGLARQYTVHLAATGEDACAVLGSHPIAAIILDAVLAHEDGLDLVQRFRSIAPVPIAVLTGHSTEDLAIRAVRAQVADYLKKPIQLTTLLETLARLATTPELTADPIQHALEHLRQDPKNLPTMHALAEHVGFSDRHLRRAFAAQTGTTPRRYLTECRLEQATHLLATTRLTVDRIARRLGYKTGTQFGRVFRQFRGLTPIAYRARSRAKDA